MLSLHRDTRHEWVQVFQSVISAIYLQNKVVMNDVITMLIILCSITEAVNLI